MDNNIIILGIESSCDDTSAAVLRDTTLLSSVIASQAVHEKYGGVIPELASRAHQQNIVPVVDTALKEAGITIDKVDAIAYTRGPGLLGSLMVGTSFAKGLSIANNILPFREDAEESINDTYLAAWNAMPPNRPKSCQPFSESSPEEFPSTVGAV